MAYEILDLGLELTLPTSGTRNWGTRVKQTTWTKVSSHDHTGNGNGQKISTTALETGAVTESILATDAVTTAKIASDAVTTVKIATDAVTTAKIASDAVTTEKLASNFGVTVYTITPPTGTTATVNFSNGMIQFLDLGSATGDVTVTLSNPEEGGIYRVFVTQAATARDLIWPVSVKWPQGQKPIFSSTDNAVDCVTLIYSAGVYYGDWQLDWS